VDGIVREQLDRELPEVSRVLRFACEEVVPRLAGTTDELDNLLHGLSGGFVPAGPSGSPTRGLVGVLPTGRNFYSVDPKAIPSRNAWAVGVSLGDSLLSRYLADHGEYPSSVGLVVWGTSAMRTAGDDIAEALWLLGVRPGLGPGLPRVVDLEVVPAAELGRPRVDVTLRISGFFRDAFPHVVQLLDDAVQLVAGLDEADNFLRATCRPTSRSAPTSGGPPRGSSAASRGVRRRLLPAHRQPRLEDRRRPGRGLGVWGGYAYGKGLEGAPARGDMERVYTRMKVAAKNQDTREHDIVDSDDYFQYHGGMVAAVRALTGESHEAYVGDSAVPDTVRTRTLQEETHGCSGPAWSTPSGSPPCSGTATRGRSSCAATVDYLFGYDATAGVVDDWMYEKLASAYVFDETNARSCRRATRGPCAASASGCSRRPTAALWEEPSAETLGRGCSGPTSSSRATSRVTRPADAAPPLPARLGAGQVGPHRRGARQRRRAAGRHGRQRRAARARPRPRRRLRRPAVDGQRLPAEPGRAHPARRLARRPLRPAPAVRRSARSGSASPACCAAWPRTCGRSSRPGCCRGSAVRC
jgi:cobaltochelatase CobN